MPSRARIALLTATFSVALAPSTEAQNLQGSRASVDRVYAEARAQRLAFHATPVSARRALERGALVRLTGGAHYRLHQVSHPYVLPSTKLFVERLSAQYHAACGERLVVTSALRPTSMRLPNSSPKTVHPTGMAVDLRRPSNPRCLQWLRSTLAQLDRQRVIEATEERRPPHFHVAVYPRQYRQYVNARTRGGTPAAARAAPSYRVRRGDSLWSIARHHGTSVERLKAANELRSSRIVVGQVLVIPSAR